MVTRPKNELTTQNTTLFPDNTSQEISAGDLRSYHTDQNDSLANVSGVTQGQVPVMSSTSGVLEDSSINEGTNEIDVDKPCAFRPLINVGSSQVKVLGELIYLQTTISNRTFSPMGAPFTTSGTSNPMYVKLDAVAELPAAANQTVRDETLPLTSGQSMSFTQVGASGTSHITRQFVIDITQAGDVRLEIFVGTDDTGRKIVDQDFTGLTVGENTLVFETFPYINPSYTYFIRYTAITNITIRGTTISTVFIPYSVSSGWPYSEVRVLTSDDGAHIVDLLEALTGNDRLDYNTLRNLPASGAASLTSTRLPVDGVVTSGVWNQTAFDGVHFLLDSGEVTGDLTALNAGSGTTFGNDTFFAITNLDTANRQFTLDATVTAFSGLASSRSFTLPARTTTFFYVDTGSPAPIANYSTGLAGTDQAVIVVRDTPTVATLAGVASASFNGNSGLFVVAANQVQGTESSIDSSIQIRALTADLLDADGNLIPTTATSKRNVRLEGGTLVRVFSSTDLRVISTPMRATGARYPDLPTTGILLHINSQALYNAHRNRTTVFTNSLATEVRLFQIQFPSAEGILIGFTDVFGFRNDGTGNVTVRTFQVGTTFSGGATQIVLSPGDTLYVRPTVPTMAQTGLFEIVQQGQSTDIFNQEPMNTDWYRDGNDAIAANRPAALYRDRFISDGSVRDHIKTSTSTNNPVVLRFQTRNIQDDIAWFEWWATFQSFQPLGTNVAEIEGNLPARLSAIQSTINNGYDFEFNDPGVQLSISSISHISGDTYRVNFTPALASYIAVNDTITISGVALGAFNGLFAITNIAGDRLAFDITRTPNNGASDNQGAGGTVTRPIYADAVFVSHDLRQVNFNLYTNTARTDLLTSIPSSWFDITTNPAPANNVVSIAYNSDITVVGASLTIQDDAGDFFVAKGGPRGNISFFDNRTAYNNGLTTMNRLPVTAENIVIDTLGVAEFVLPEFPDELDVGEIRRYRIHAHPNVTSNNDIEVFVGDDGDEITFDEGISSITVLPGNYVDIELHNDGNRSGVRLASPIQRTRVASPTLSATTLNTAQIDPLPISVVFVIAAQDEDPNEDFIDADTTNRRLVLNADGDYTFEAAVTVQYSGTEPTSAFLFGTLTLVPITNRGGSDTIQTAFRDVVSLEMERGGLSGAGAPKPQHTLRTRFDWQGQTNDTVRFRLSLDQVPPGFSAADFEVRDFTWNARVQLGLN